MTRNKGLFSPTLRGPQRIAEDRAQARRRELDEGSHLGGARAPSWVDEVHGNRIGLERCEQRQQIARA
jgi:hypothetical protein